ncbi:hypothetical protein BC828DRAFT_293377 [Blastocladiella britannica]|nr:hypothetical protein BC828DRAFT_293377 [Blastocladiella britannica]
MALTSSLSKWPRPKTITRSCAFGSLALYPTRCWPTTITKRSSTAIMVMDRNLGRASFLRNVIHFPCLTLLPSTTDPYWPDIESVTRKTGNFKKFDVFVNMLVSGMSQSEPSIHLDLLTTQDLESLNQSGSSSSTTLPPLPADRRFLIMSYLVSFDRVHYPLPLAYCPQPTDASTLLAMLAHLQSDNERLEQATHELQFQLQQSRSASTARGRQESAARDAESARRDSRLEHLEREIEDLAQALELAHDDARKWRNRYDDLAAAQTTRAAMPVTTRSRNSSPAATAARGGSSSGRPQYSARSPSSSSFTGSPSRQPASRAPPPHTPPRAPWGSRRAAHDSNGRSPAASRRPATMPPTSTQSPNRRLPPPPGAARPHSSPTRRGSDPASLPQRRPNWQRSWSKDRGLARQVPPPLATRGTHLPPAAVVTARTNSGYVPLRSKPLRTADNRGSPIKRFDPTEWARRHADRFGRDAAAAVPERPASGARDRSHSAGSQRSVQSSYSTRSAQAAPSSNRYTTKKCRAWFPPQCMT